MVKVIKKFFQISLICCSFVIFSTQAIAANFNNLSFMGTYVDRHPTTLNVFLPFIDEVKTDLDGRVTFNYFSSNVLFPESEAYAVYSDGRVDFSALRPGLFPGVLNLVTVTDIPGMAPNAIVGSLLAQDVVEKFPEIKTEFPEQAEFLTMWTSAAYQIHTIKPIKSIDELKGKKIIAWDAVTKDILEKLGANPMRLMAVDTYLSLSKGMADGVICPIAAVRSFKISDVAKYHLILDLNVGSFLMSAYKPLWDEFPADIQEYFRNEAGAKFSLRVGKSIEDSVLDDSKWMLGLGHEFYYPDEAQKVQRAELLAPSKEEWLEHVPAEHKEIAKEILKYAEERSLYYQSEFEKGTYGDYTLE